MENAIVLLDIFGKMKIKNALKSHPIAMNPEAVFVAVV